MPSLGVKFRKVSNLFYLYFPAAARAVIASGEHLSDLLFIKAFSDGALAEAVSEEIRFIRKKAPRAYCPYAGGHACGREALPPTV
jgi:hypothetical protein